MPPTNRADLPRVGPLARSVRQLARTIEHHARERHTRLRPSTGDPLLREYELYAAPRRARRW